MIHLIRAAKYFLSLCVLCTILIGALFALGMAAGSLADLIHMLFYTTKGLFFLGAVLFLSAIYPRIGFMTARVGGQVDAHRKLIVEAFATEGFMLQDNAQDVLTFRAATFGRRILLRFDDTVTVRQNGEVIQIEGARKVVARVEYKLEAYIRHNE